MIRYPWGESHIRGQNANFFTTKSIFVLLNNTQFHHKKNQATLLSYWFRFNQTSKSVDNFSMTKQLNVKIKKYLTKNSRNQTVKRRCSRIQSDQITRLFVHYLAIYNNANLPKSINKFPKVGLTFCQILNRPLRNGQKTS